MLRRKALKSGLQAVMFAVCCGAAAIIGCGAEGASDANDESTPDPEANRAQLPPSGGAATGTTDAASPKKDAGPTSPEPGDPCPKIDEIFERSCGACGKQEAICTRSGDAGGLNVSEYGACTGEAEGACIPGTIENIACGNCGTAKRTCNGYCAWTTSTCAGQPTDSCKPGKVEYTTAGCTVSNTYRRRTCAATCTWTATTSVCEEPNNPNKLTISGTVKGTVVGDYALTAAAQSKRQPTYTCGASATLSSTVDHPYVVVEVKNATAKSASITATTAGTPTDIAVILTAYSVTVPPTTDDELKACSKATSSLFTWPSLSGVTIGAGAKILLRVQAYHPESSPTFASTGNFTLTLKTDALN